MRSHKWLNDPVFQRLEKKAFAYGLTRLIFLFGILILSISNAFAGDGKNNFALVGAYTINQGLPTAGTNFNSFTDFSAALTAQGVTGNVVATVVPGSGPYTEQVIFQSIAGIGAGATVTIEGSGETITSDTAINQTGSNPNRHIIRLIDLQYFTVNNLHVDMFPGSTGFIGIHILNSGNHMTISNCVVNMGSATSTLLGAFVVNGIASSILTPGGNFNFINITGNTTTGGGYGASLSGLASPLATNVVISNNTINDFNTNGIYLRETDGAIVSANHFDKSAGATASVNAIQLAQLANVNGRVFGNFIKMSQTAGSLVGIYLFAGTGHKVYNNMIYDIRSTTGTIEGIRVRTGASAPEIYFNTISFDNAASTSGNLKGFREELSNTGSILRNNIFRIGQTTSGTKTAIELASTSNVITAINSNNNVFWIPGGNVAMRSTTAYATLNAWQTASTQDAASFETDPFFQSATNPIPTSGVINNQALAGTGITTDITNAVRSATPDPGAYEFVPPSGDAAMTDFILPLVPHCANTLAVQFELTNAGGDPLNSVTINWTVNGVPQPVVNWTGPTLPSGMSTIVTLGTVPVTGTNIYNFTATSSNPNGGPDVNPGNDSHTYNGFRRGLEGVFTINGSAPTSPTNYQSFQAIANDLSLHGVCSAVTINVLNGPYTEQVVFNTIPGTNATNRVTLNGNGQVLQYDPTNASIDHILQINAVNYMIVENLTVNSLNATQGRGIHITNGSSKLVIRNNTVNVSLTNSTSSAFGIIISGDNWLLDGSLSDSVVISGNTVSGGYSAIQLSGVHWTQPLTRISVINNTVLDWYGFGVYLSYTNGALVSKNIIRRPNRTNSGSDAVTPAGITVPAGSLLFLLEKNKIYDLHLAMPGTPTISRGVHMSGTTTAPTSGTIQNNLIYGMNNDGAQYGIQNNSVTGPVNIYHNTIVLNNATGAATSNTNALNLSNSTTQNDMDIRNNIFVVTRGGTGVKRIIDVAASSAPLTSNYNAAWLNAPGGTQSYGQIGSTTYTTFSDWQTLTGKDANSVFADPLFVNPASGNFTPTNATVDGASMATTAVGGITDDIFDVLRSINPDAGAIEFNPAACSVPSGGTASTSSGPFCTSGSGTITATGYSSGAGITYQWQYSNDNFVSNINDLAGQTNPATASTGVISSTTYYRLKVTCSSGPTSTYSNIVVIIVNQPVSITTHPASQTVCSGTNVTFTVVASGSGLSYQWRKNTINIGGAISASYTIIGVTVGDAGNYDVVVTGACGPVTSNIAVLTVNAATAITTQPLSQSVCTGANVTFTVIASGTGITYQWRKNTVNIGGAISASYTITGVVAGDAGNYDVVVTGTCGTVTSNTAVLTINAATAITTHPVSQTVCSGTNVTFTVVATGGGLTYQWRKNTIDIGGAISASYTITGVTAGDAGNYDVVVTGACGTVTSNTAVLTVNAATVISTQPLSQSVCTGANVTFTVVASGTGISYQWRKNTVNIGGATLASYTITGVVAGDAGNYDVVVTGTCGTVTSNIAVLTVNAATAITTQPVSQTVCSGTNVSFTVVATGSGLTYQWRKNTINIGSAIAATYTITGVTAGDMGNYDVMVTGACGTITSNTAVLTVNAATAITTQPISQALCAGGNVSFTVVATGTGLTYQWRKNTVNIGGAIAATYTITGVTAGDAANYDVVVSGACGNITSATAILTVTSAGTWTGLTSTDWNTASNWCGGIPTAGSDVLIPALAPNMPNLSAGNGAARNISINSGASLTVGAGGLLEIYGNLVNNSVFNAAAGNLAFRGATAQSIAAFTTINATMNGSGGVLLGGNSSITGTLTLSNGHITLGANSLTLAAGSTGSLASHIIINGTGNVIASGLAASTSRSVPIGINATSYNPATLTANAGHVTDNFTIGLKQGVFINGVVGALFTSEVVDRTWVITEGAAGGSNINLSLQWTSVQELSGFDRTRSFIMRHNGTAWLPATATTATGTNPYTQTLNGLTAFSSFAVRTQAIPRPVTGIYPNPAKTVLNVVLDLPAAGDVEFSIYDAIGRLVSRTDLTLAAGISQTVLDVSRLSGGEYTIKVSTYEDPKHLVQKFIKQN